jgi:hypothetical protein
VTTSTRPSAACYHYLKHRDTRPILVATLLNPDLTVYDLTGADEVEMHIHLDDGGVISRTMTIDPTPTTGIVRYTWLATDWTDTTHLYPGFHRLEYEVRGPATVRATFPNRDTPETRHILEVGGDIGQGS